MSKDLLLITPPFTQLNTPYPATAYLKGFLNTKDISSFQMDLGIEVILELFSAEGLTAMFHVGAAYKEDISDNALRIQKLKKAYISTIDIVISFLQGKQQSLARQISGDNFLPRASRFDQIDDLDWAFGEMGLQDMAKHMATLYLEDISDYIQECVDPNFGFSRYAERLGRSANSFDNIFDYLQTDLSYIDQLSIHILENTIGRIQPKLVCFSVPFPGNLISAFRCAQYLKINYPSIKIAMGGGFPNTELRSIKDVRVFNYVDYITLDDGELPIELLAANVLIDPLNNSDYNLLKRTFLLDNEEVLYNNFSLRKDYKQEHIGTPDYTDLRLDRYISVIEIANPMHSLWSDGRWLKLTMAHGCYWGKCTFCDVSLDYISKYEPVAAAMLVDRMEEMIASTGERGFHFLDEAAPPALMREVALEIVRRDLTVTWWTNIRFEKNFTWDLCRLLSRSGCIAVSGGLEVASDRLLALIKKGVTVEQVAQVAKNFSEAGIMVHAYLMYGYPTQTEQETVDSLEMVRQMFEIGILRSGFWHQFALTAHSPIGLNPKDFGIVPDLQEITFANNDIEFTDSTGIDHNKFGFGLKKSLFNYMHGICFEYPLQDWFDMKIPTTKIGNKFIENCLKSNSLFQIKPSAKLVWLGIVSQGKTYNKNKKGKAIEMMALSLINKATQIEISLPKEKGDWLLAALSELEICQGTITTFADLKSDYSSRFDDFDLFWYGSEMDTVREYGLVIL